MLTFRWFIFVLFAVGSLAIENAGAQTASPPTTYCEALFARDTAAIFSFLRRGQDPNEHCLYHTSRKKLGAYIPIIGDMMRQQYRTTSHHITLLGFWASHNDVPNMKRLLTEFPKTQIDKKSDGKTALLLAMEKNSKQAVDFLLPLTNDLPKNYTYVYEAVKKKDNELLKRLLAAHATPNDNANEYSPLVYAYQHDNRTAVELLLQHKADILGKDKLYKGCLEVAVKKNDLPMIKRIREISKARLPEVVYYQAAIAGKNTALVKWLIDNDYQPILEPTEHAPTAYDYCVEFQDSTSFTMIVKKFPVVLRNPINPFALELRFFQFLERRKVDMLVNWQNAPIDKFVFDRKNDWLEEALKNGVDPNMPIGAFRDTPLYRAAAQYNGKETVEILLRYGADPNIASGFQQTTAFMRVAQYGNAETIELVLKSGGDKQKTDKSGLRAYHYLQKNSRISLPERERLEKLLSPESAE
jgi:ankyrin repeat protein